jgi:methylated-DNA-[protein]-cysteine S-methyltransferase
MPFKDIDDTAGCGCVNLDSPIGPLRVCAVAGAVTAVEFVASTGKAQQPDAVAVEAARQLAEYFDGRRRKFDLPLAPQGTVFQQAVWQQMLAVPHGSVTTYGLIAAAIGRPRAARAVGLASGCNPITLLIPCHRVIGSNGRLTGYGSGLWRKEWLLKHERGL